MMGEVVNLRRARKTVARQAKEANAAVNRAVHGMPKAERDRSRAQAVLADRKLDGHQRSTDSGEPGSS